MAGLVLIPRTVNCDDFVAALEKELGELGNCTVGRECRRCL